MIDKLGLVEFIIYIAPGFLARQVYLSVYPAKKAELFQQVGWSVLYSIWIVSTIRYFDSRFALSLHSREQGFPYARFIFATQALGLLVGLFFVLIQQLRHTLAQISPRLNGLSPDPQSIWARVNDSSNEDWAVVFLDDGAIYRSYISDFRFDPDADEPGFPALERKPGQRRFGGDLPRQWAWRLLAHEESKKD